MNTSERSMQKFLAVYRIMPNLNMSSGLSPSELMFARKIRTVSDRLLPSPAKKTAKKENLMNKAYKLGDKVFFKNFKAGKNVLGRGNDNQKNWSGYI